MAALRSLPDLAAALSRSLAERGIDHTISGAIAMAAHGYVRATTDLDLLVVAPSVRWPEVFAIVRSLGFAGEDREMVAAIRERGVATFQAGPVSIEILVPVLPYHRTLPSRSVAIHVAGASIPVLSIEDLVVLKMLWRRQKDLADIHALLQLAGGSFDDAYALRTLATILPGDDPRHAELRSLIGRFARPPGVSPER